MSQKSWINHCILQQPYQTANDLDVDAEDLRFVWLYPVLSINESPSKPFRSFDSSLSMLLRV